MSLYDKSLIMPIYCRLQKIIKNEKNKIAENVVFQHQNLQTSTFYNKHGRKYPRS